MKICIITEPLTCNYGGILQNYALQTVLKKHGHDPYTFDVGKFTWFDWFVNCTAILCHKLSGKKLEFEKSPYYRKTKETPLRKFVANKIALVKPKQKRLNLKCLKKYKFDAYIVGSDQVWRPKYNSDLTDKFLAFLGNEKDKRIAYAASFGSDFWGIWNKHPELDDDKGTSVVFVNSKQGRMTTSSLNVYFCQASYQDAIISNPMQKQSTTNPVQRSLFWLRYKTNGLACITPILNSMKPKLAIRVINRINRIFK